MLIADSWMPKGSTLVVWMSQMMTQDHNALIKSMAPKAWLPTEANCTRSTTPNAIRFNVNSRRLDKPRRRSQASNSLRSETPMRVSQNASTLKSMQPLRVSAGAN
jgi:hypothetical protein